MDKSAFSIYCFICGIAWLVALLIRAFIKNRSLDLGDGIYSNWYMYLMAIPLWWYWLYKEIKD